MSVEALTTPAQPKTAIDTFDDLAPLYVAEEGPLVRRLSEMSALSESQRVAIEDRAANIVRAIRSRTGALPFVDALLQEFGLSTDEGVTLMRLSEALIRTPDFATSRRLIRDKLGDGDWLASDGERPFLVAGTAAGLQLSRTWINRTGGVAAADLVAKLGDRVLHVAVERAMAVMGEHFVLGQTIDKALSRADASLHAGVTHSFDMLGEGARTLQDAERYHAAYVGAIRSLVAHARAPAAIEASQGMSVKLSALHPRFEYAQRERCTPILVERVRDLALMAKGAGLGLTIDAEEADRLELGLTVFETMLGDPALAGWDGMGVVIQAYQRRAAAVVERVVQTARAAGRRIAVRLVKGAYWDMEIKRAQELGLESYPVFTRKENTDVSYLACARLLLDARDVVYPQFATHNAHTALAVHAMAGDAQGYEVQRLHGMGDTLHAELMDEFGLRSRVYAPVGDHKDLLPYLVRRLLENGANSSFVHQLLDADVAVEDVVEDPLQLALAHTHAQHPGIPNPRDLFNGARLSAQGLDLTQSAIAETIEHRQASTAPREASSVVNGQPCGSAREEVRNPAARDQIVGHVQLASPRDVDAALAAAAQSTWSSAHAEDRARRLLQAADQLEAQMLELMELCVLEAGKTWPDAVAEIREAVDFCRYYANQATSDRMAGRAPLGVVACISPWNFPLAIFLGQVTAALAAGNTVVAKPAEQTPLIAARAVAILHACGIPADALHLVLGDGRIGAHLVAQSAVKGVVFTGSTATARRIALTLADTGRPDTPLIAETGGINAMIIDSTALLEQAVQDVVASAFQSAGQRCSACRVVCVQDEVAEDFIRMLAGAMDMLAVGDPTRLETDVGPLIDAQAHADIAAYVADMRTRSLVIGEAPLPASTADGCFLRPVALEVESVADVTREVFGPVLHIVRFRGDRLPELIDDINRLGYGLTMGLHTRIDARVDAVATQARVGNLYVNRNQIGAVVGVQPFGGEGLSGTGPKAGGPHYVLQLSRPGGAQKPATSGGSAQSADQASLPSPATPGPLSLNVKDVVAQARAAVEGRQTGADNATGLDVLREAFGDVGSPDAVSLDALIAIARNDIGGPQPLPGPTGEANTLTLHPRGVLGVVSPRGEPSRELWLAMAKALAAGNAIIVAGDEETSGVVGSLAKALTARGAPEALVQTIAWSDALPFITEADIDGVVATAVARHLAADHLRRRENGPLLPTLSAEDDLTLFCLERTMTINTTAAGGNASLLAMGG